MILFLPLIVIGVGYFLSRLMKIVDKPHLYVDTKGRQPIPTLQGIWWTLAIVLAFGLVLDGFPQPYGYVVFGLLVLCFVGTIDDVAVGLSLHPLVRFGVQVLCSVVLVYGADIPLTVSFFPLPSSIGLVLSVVRCLLCINALNRFDGINGQASGMASIGFFTIAFVILFVVLPAYPAIDEVRLLLLDHVGIISFVAGVLCLVMSVIEWKPWGLVRDAGILPMGLLLAFLSLQGGAKVGTMLVVLLPVILDSLWVIVHRLVVLRKAPWKGDYTHLHHRLQGLGWSKKESKVAVWIRGIVMAVMMLIQGDNSWNKVIIFLLMAALFWGINAYVFWVKKLPVGFSHAIKPYTDDKKLS
ncbi:MAG: undecaprenyl/decaprenyl-phosphate alpha-N-acetylglucosaminyl 1-phosphate transferase [Candidatus Absconditabacterales bacterium]|nr:undecaprenyl/decaprenyl-phosphate alpha-N-acetylglucosaminyl 1-phosphate transferase [Candidatus Absconditabacterales bacterium]